MKLYCLPVYLGLERNLVDGVLAGREAYQNYLPEVLKGPLAVAPFFQ
jgi:hypothetical protein